MAEAIAPPQNITVIQILSEMIQMGLISPQLAQQVLEYLYFHYGDLIFT